MQRLKGQRFKRALAAGIKWFSHYRKQVDKINVFPVSDADTGKNMYAAFQAALKEVQTIHSNSAAEIAQAAARGALMGGRGCSGMILSGFFSGFAEAVGDQETLSAHDLARAFQIGSQRARERVEHPQEGTILSVGDQAALDATAEAQVSQGLFQVLESAWQGAAKALARTSQQLKVLDENQVVDAGGLGLVYFFEGLVRYSRRQSVALSAVGISSTTITEPTGPLSELPITPFKFCVEFVLTGEKAGAQSIRNALQPVGEHIMVASAAGSVFKVHVHARDPEAVFAKVSALGRITWKKVDDMEKQHQDSLGLKSSALKDGEFDPR